MANLTDESGWHHRILLVDDEEGVLNALKRCLKKEGYQIDAFTDPVAALEQAGQVQYDLVLSDYKMPELDGVMLLGLIRQIQPDAKRLILSAYTDKDALVEAINQARIERFITKPWDSDSLRFELRQALEIDNLAGGASALAR